MENSDSLEKRAKKHAKAMFEHTPSPSKSKSLVTDCTSVDSNATETSPVPQLDVLTTPRKKSVKNLTPRKLITKAIPSTLWKRGKQISRKISEMNDMPRDVLMVGEQGTSSSVSDVSDTEDGDLDKILNSKATSVNLSKRNVKSIIHHLLTNEHVIKLYKDALRAQDDKSPESPIKSSNMGTLETFPKMTRSKVKDFMEKSNIPPSPCKKPNSGPSILEVDFAEEEDDDEYSPEKDETNETDDDESVVSSYLSEFGSPCPVTPSTPVPHIGTDRPTLSMSPSIINSPLSSASKRLRIDLSECEGLSETEDEGTIALRTRSKKSLMDTSLMDIEQAFVAPDITPDMYETCYKDKDWTDFLNSLYKSNADESTIDDEVNDPEFNYFAEAEEEAFDDEDFRFDKPTKVSKKELNSLIEELHNLFEDEVLPLQVVAEASSSQDPISQLVSFNMKDNPSTASAVTSLPILPAPTQKTQTFPPQNSQQFNSPPFQNVQPNFPINNQCHEMPSSNQFNNSVSNYEFKVPYIPPQSDPLVTPSQQLTEATQNDIAPEGNIQHYQKMVIEDNIRKHIQLLTQTFLLAKAENFSNKVKVTNAAKDMLIDLNSRKFVGRMSSVMNVCNLEEAVRVVSVGSLEEEGRNDYDKSGAMEELKMTIFNNPTFMYPDLLPRFERVRIKKEASRPRCVFLPSEDNLIALGLEQFTDCRGVFPSELIHQYLVRSKTVNEIYHRIMFLSSSRAGINHVKKLRKLGHRVQLDPPIIHPIDFRPPRLKNCEELPHWCQKRMLQALVRQVNNNSQGNGSTFVPIKPKPGCTHTKTNHSLTNSSSSSSSSSSSVISIRKKRVPNTINPPKKGKQQETSSNSFIPPSATSESSNYLASPLHLNNTDIEFSHSPDLLKKAMASCGIDGIPSPNSSSSPLPTDKPKPTSVKNLTSAFEESEMIITKSCDQVQDKNLESVHGSESCAVMDLDETAASVSNNISNMPGDSSSRIETSKLSNLSDTHGCRESSLPSDVSTKLDSGDKISPDLNVVKNSFDSTKTVKDNACVNEEVDETMTEDKNESNISKEQNLLSNDRFDRIENSTGEGSEKNNSVKESRSDLDNSRVECHVSQDDSANVAIEETKDKSGDSGSSNKLEPWISSIISQFETQDSDPGCEKKNTESVADSDSSVKVSKTLTPPGALDANISEMLKSPESSPIKLTVYHSPSPKRTPSKLHPIAPKASPCPKSVPYVPLPRISPKRKELNRQVRHILPKSFVFESKIPSPTKTTALNLKKKATLLCQKSPVKILPRTVNVPAADRDIGMKTRGRSSMLTRSQRGISKPKIRGEPYHKELKRVKKTEEDYESAKETESEASEFEESGLSQEEDEDRTKLDDLMAASTTIRFGSKQLTTATDDDVKTKAEKKKAVSLSLLQPDLVQNDPKKDDRDTAFAQQYFNQVKETLSSDPERFYKFLSLLKDLNKDHTSPVELYLDMVLLLSDHQQLVDDFAGFLLSFQAIECQCFSTNFQYTQIRQFLRQVEVHCGSSTTTYRKVLKALSTWSSMCQEGKLEGGLREKMLTILKNVPGVLDNLISYFLDGAVSDCHSMDFEDICLDEEEDGMDKGKEDFENVVLPDEPEDYNTKTCSCQCHSNNPQDDRYQRRIKHCVSCSLQVYDGQPVLKLSRYMSKPMSIVYSSEEEKLAQDKEKCAEAKIEAAQIVLAKAKVQQQQQIGRKRKGGLEFTTSKSKRICKQSEKGWENGSSDSDEEVSAESESEEVKGNEKIKQVKTTPHLTEKPKIERKRKTNKEEMVDTSGKDDIGVKVNKSRIRKSNKLESRPNDLGINQVEMDKAAGDSHTEANIEAAQIVLANTKVQQQQQIRRKRKGGLEFTTSKSKRIRKQSEKDWEDGNSDSDGKGSAESGSEEVKGNEKVKQVKTTTQLTEKPRIEKKGKTNKEEMVDASGKDDIGGKVNKSRIRKSKKLESKPNDLGINQVEMDKAEEESHTDKGQEQLDLKNDQIEDAPKLDGFESKSIDLHSKAVVSTEKSKSKKKVGRPVKAHTNKKGSKQSQDSASLNRPGTNKDDSLPVKSSDSIDDKKNKIIIDNSTGISANTSYGENDDLTDKINNSGKMMKTTGYRGDGEKEVKSRKAEIKPASKGSKSQFQLIVPDNDREGEIIRKSNKQKESIAIDKRDSSHTKAVGPSGDCKEQTPEESKNDEKLHTRQSDHQPSKKLEDKTFQNENEIQGTEEISSLETCEEEKEFESKAMHSEKLCNKSCGSETSAANDLEGNDMKVDNEAISEMFDRYILDNLSDEGLTPTALRNIHDKFPLRSMQMIQDRAQQLLSLLETMSDESTDVEESNKRM